MKLCPQCSHEIGVASWNCSLCNWSPPMGNGFPTLAPELAQESPGFSKDYFAELASLEQGHFWFESRNKLILRVLKHNSPDMKTFLEIGCGTGFVLSAIHAAFPTTRVWGSEVFTEGLHFASNRLPSAKLFQMDARQIPFRDEFDTIGAFDVIEHIEEDGLVLHQIKAALRPGGVVVITVPQHGFLWTAIDDFSYHKRRYTRKELLRKLQAAGFEVLSVTSFVSLLFPLLLVSRLRMRKPSTDFDPRAELRISTTINQVLSGIMALERALLRLVSLPFGGSLLVAARRPY